MTLENKNIRKLIFGLCLLFVVTWLGVKILDAFKQNAKAFEDDLPSVYDISSHDSNLITPKYRNSIEVLEVKRSKVRNNILTLSIAEEYTVIIHKLNLRATSSLTKAVHTIEANTDRSTGITYSIFDYDNFTYQCKAGIAESTNDLYLTLSSKTLQSLIANDSTISYFLKAKDLSLQYGADSPVDIFISAKQNIVANKTVPMNIMLVKKDGAVYFIVLTTKSGKEFHKPDVIHEIINITA